MIGTFKVIQDFDGSNAISGSAQRFRRGDVVYVDFAQEGELLTIETEGFMIFVADRQVLERSCKEIMEGGLF